MPTASGASSTIHVPLRQEVFRGLYSRGINDIAPDGFFLDCLNTKYITGGVLSRDGVGLQLDTSGHTVVRFFRYRRFSETPRFIYLDSSGNLRDSLFTPPIWTDASILDFSMTNYNNRVYITPHDRKNGLSNKSVLVYDGSGVARLAGGSPPTGFTLTLANSSVSGNIELGYHFFAVAFVTDTGFITAPGPAVYPSINAPGGQKVDLSGLPLGGANVVARVILATKAVPPSLFTSNQLNYELFFVPSANGGLISDNTSTTASVSFFDNELLDSADYLIDNLSKIPAGVGIGVYNGRLIVWGEVGNPFTVRASQKLQPESFSSINGFININPANSGDGIRNCFEQRKSLIIATPTKFLATTDNGSDPNTWDVPETVEDSIGTECFGVATISDTKASSSSRIFIATHPGLVSFEGYIKKPELSYNIESVWFRINKAAFNTVQVVDDPTNHLVYVMVPLDSATSPDHLLVGDYTESFTPYGTIDPNNIKWSIWQFFEGGSILSSIAGDLDDTTKSPVLFFSRDVGNIYITGKNNGLTNDTGAAIDSFVQLNLKTPQRDWVSHFAGIKLRVIGYGNLQISLSGEDSSGAVSVPSIALSSSPGSEPDRIFNFKNEKCSVKLRVSFPDEKFNLSKVTLYAKPLWLRRPS
jgi:hypothetical protein